MSRLIRPRALVALATSPWLAFAPLTGTARADEGVGGLIDVSGTVQGQDALAATANHDGIDPDAYEAVENVPGDPTATWVLPVGSALPTVAVAGDGSVDVDVDVADSANALADDGAGDTAAHAAQVHWETPKCYARYTQTAGAAEIGWFDHCEQWANVNYDHDDKRDHYVCYQYGTCKSSSQFALTSCKLGERATGASPSLSWEDWAPRSDSTGGCRSQSLSISALGIGVSGSYEACESLDITKYRDAGRFSAAWQGYQHLHERTVQYRVVLGVAQGKTPQLRVHWHLDGVVFIP